MTCRFSTAARYSLTGWDFILNHAILRPVVSFHSISALIHVQHINIDPKNVHILNGNAPNLVAECDEYERKIEAAGGIDLFMAGIGPDGHIAFNEPGT